MDILLKAIFFVCVCVFCPSIIIIIIIFYFKKLVGLLCPALLLIMDDWVPA